MRKHRAKILNRKIKYRPRNNFEYFFYAYDSDNAESLTKELTALGYSAEITDISDSSILFLINGFTSDYTSIDKDIASWFNQMTNLAKKHKCEFDGWERRFNI